MPPWKKTSRLGQTSSRFDFPVKARICFIKTRYHDGTPEIFVTFSLTVVLVICSSFSSKSSRSAIFCFGVLIISTQKGAFSIRIAERSPYSESLLNWFILWLPPRVRLFPENIRVSGLCIEYMIKNVFPCPVMTIFK